MTWAVQFSCAVYNDVMTMVCLYSVQVERTQRPVSSGPLQPVPALQLLSGISRTLPTRDTAPHHQATTSPSHSTLPTVISPTPSSLPTNKQALRPTSRPPLLTPPLTARGDITWGVKEGSVGVSPLAMVGWEEATLPVQSVPSPGPTSTPRCWVQTDLSRPTTSRFP